MSGRIALIHPARHFISNHFGVGYLTPLGLISIGGPLIDAGFKVRLIDHDLYGWSNERLIQELTDFNADYALLGHSGSTAAHTTAIKTTQAIRKALPRIRIIYGGVYPSYAHQSILREHQEIDVIVRGEGEQIIVELISALEQTSSLETVPGITWRNGDKVIVNRSHPPLQNLDAYRFGWELVDWPRYQMFGFDRAAGLQFSRGCPLTCSYCGQWLFWKKWRHRSPENILEQLRLLVNQYGVKLVWFADENFAADRELTKQLLEMIIEADFNVSLNVNMTAADVVRDADLLPLYKRAGIDYIVMGIESLNDQVIANVRKNNPYAISKEAVRLLRENNIISLMNIIYGLEEENWRTIFDKFKGMLEMDGDILNAMYLTPHFWTAQGRETNPSTIIQTDLAKWTYRNQVIANPHLKPLELFFGVKLTEALFHLRPKALLRLVIGKDKRYLKIIRRSMLAGIRVVLAEVYEFFWKTKFSPQGSLKQLPDSKYGLSILENR
ncbi:MAG TPA: radical SAM protein [Anaerolineales bacterium]|nr:radical SAM protein [Anaerolineales bacterium]